MIFHQPHNSRKNFNYNAFVYRGISFASHFHGNYELIYALTATVYVTINGTERRLLPGEMLLITPYTVHSFSIQEEKTAWIGVFSEDFIPAFARKNKNVQYDVFRAAEDLDAFLRKKLFFEGQPPHYALIGYLYLILQECSVKASPLKTENKQEFMNHAVSYIEQHYHDDASLSALADLVGYEYHYASSLFHKCFAMDFKKFLNFFRVETACLLLAEGAHDITAISAQCGFTSIRNFNRVFKEITGMTPSVYQKSRG